MTNTVAFEVPGKLDTNHRVRAAVVGGKVRTYKASGYRAGLVHIRLHAAEAFAATRGWSLLWRYTVRIVTHEPDRRSRDLDNAVKPILDALTGIAWANDSRVDCILVVRGDVRRDAPCTVVQVRGCS